MAGESPRPPGPGPGLRAAQTADLSQLELIEQVCFGDHAWTPSQLRSSLSHPHVVALASTQGSDREGDLVGYALGWSGGGGAELLRIAVHPEQRHRGAGRDLLSAFCAACRHTAADVMWLELRADNLAALALYSSAGLTRTGTRSRYYPDGTDAILMEARLISA